MRLALAAVAALALTAVTGAVGGGNAAKTIGTRGKVVEISADGDRVAIHAEVQGDPVCDSGSVWRPAPGTVVRFQDASCGPKASDSQYDELRLAGTRAAWVDYDYGNHAYCNGPYVATLARPKPANTGKCPAEPDNEDMYWEFAGDGSLLVASSYVLCEASCEPDYDRTYDGQVTIWRVGIGMTKLLVAKDDTKLFDVDAGRILLRDPSKELLVLDAAGKEVGAVTPSGVGDAKLSGSNQVVAVSKGTTLSVYDAATGKLVKTAQMRGEGKLMDVENGVAVYFSATEVRLLTLATGRERLIARQKGLVQADLEPGGLFYAYNVPGGGTKAGRVTFVPTSALRK